MSKIGRMPIDIGQATVEVHGQEVQYKGKKASGAYELPVELVARVQDKKLFVEPKVKSEEYNQIWGLHRALLANKIIGADKGFERQLRIVGLGFKAALVGNKVQLALGYTNKIDYPLPASVTFEVDKSGQLLTFKSTDKEALGKVCSEIRALRPPEPYKGTGVQYVGEVIRRKAGKANA